MTTLKGREKRKLWPAYRLKREPGSTKSGGRRGRIPFLSVTSVMLLKITGQFKF